MKITRPIIERRVIRMILFTILALIAFILIVLTLIVVSVGGAIGVVLFSDVIVCIGIIILIMKLIKKKKK